MKTLAIGITTFRNRINDVKKEIIDIRKIDNNIDILLAITTNYNEKMPEEYRRELLTFCCQYDNIYPLMFSKYTGLAKMWNNLIVNAATTHILIMNDDVNFENYNAIEQLKIEIQSKEIFMVHTFGAFVISKEIANDLNYFDERFISYGREDGDFKNRYLEKYGKEIDRFPIKGISNRIQNRREDSHDVNIQCEKDYAGGYKSHINTVIMGMKNRNKWQNEKQYPYEKFINDNFNNIGNVGEIKL